MQSMVIKRAKTIKPRTIGQMPDVVDGRVINIKEGPKVSKYEFSVSKKTTPGRKNKVIKAVLNPQFRSKFDFGDENPAGVRHVLNLDVDNQRNGEFEIIFDSKEPGSYLTLQLPKAKTLVLKPLSMTRQFKLTSTHILELRA